MGRGILSEAEETGRPPPAAALATLRLPSSAALAVAGPHAQAAKCARKTDKGATEHPVDCSAAEGRRRDAVS